ncbi:MAG: 4Fe-4S binding protein [Candidatus Omnitrophica bacterium]|nr:4Fe-4S binding protein [Candidatus Omnitrophota bacterium]MCM8793026.1 4Fe-4S binding protein [Candidatus Omnitrophota bacterium]
MENSLLSRELKGWAYLKQRQKELFCLRIKTPLGMLNAEQLLKLAEIAKNYGQGIVHLTTRQGIEIPYVHQENIFSIKEELGKVNLDISVSGPRIRAVVSCPGTCWCPWAWVDTLVLAGKIEKEFYGKEEIEIQPLGIEMDAEIPGINPEDLAVRLKNKICLPHKFRISVSGCTNSCARAQESEIGFCGQVMPEWHKEKCNFLRICERVCPTEAIKIHPRKKEIELEESKCVYCGLCILNCPQGAWQVKLTGLAMYVGGKWGRFPQLGKKIANFLDENQAIAAIKKVLEFYAKEAKKGERLANLLNRVGIEKLREEIIS